MTMEFTDFHEHHNIYIGEWNQNQLGKYGSTQKMKRKEDVSVEAGCGVGGILSEGVGNSEKMKIIQRCEGKGK